MQRYWEDFIEPEIVLEFKQEYNEQYYTIVRNKQPRNILSRYNIT